MKKINLAIFILVIAVLLSAAALSLEPIINILSKTSQVTPGISVEEKNTCTTEFYNDVQDVFGACTYYNNRTSCLNTTGPNTACSTQQSTWAFSCKTGENIVTKNKTTCKANDEFLITIDQGNAVLKKKIDYSEWGPCIHSQENINGNSCLVVTCVSLYDGAHKGQFTDCNGGKSCQRFEICDGSIKSFYKNSREEFTQDDPSFYMPKLEVSEWQ